METGDALVLAGELGLEVGVFGLQTGKLFLKRVETLEELLGVWWVPFSTANLLASGMPNVC